MPNGYDIEGEKILEEVDPMKEKKKHNFIKSQQVIRDFLLQQKDNRASIWDCYQACVKHYKARRLKPPKYSSIRVIIHVLRKFRVIRDVGEEPPEKTWTMHNKKIIEIVEGQENHPIWDDLWAYYSEMRKGRS